MDENLLPQAAQAADNVVQRVESFVVNPPMPVFLVRLAAITTAGFLASGTCLFYLPASASSSKQHCLCKKWVPTFTVTVAVLNLIQYFVLLFLVRYGTRPLHGVPGLRVQQPPRVRYNWFLVYSNVFYLFVVFFLLYLFTSDVMCADE